MEVAAAAIAFAQAIGMVTTSIRIFHSLRQASAEFMDLLNQLSTLNGQAELFRRSLDSLAAAHSDVPVVDIDTIHNLQLQFEDISRQLNEAATSFISQSKGLDDKGRHRIPRLFWHKDRSKLLGLRERARQLNSDMTDCLTAINTSEGTRQTGLLLDVRTVMDQSFMNVASQVQQGNVLAEKTHESVDRIVQQHENQVTLLHSTLASHRETGAEIGRRLDVFETRVEAQLSQVMSHLSFTQDGHLNRAGQGSRTEAQFDQTMISVSTTVRSTCPLNCRCQCHRTSYVRTPGWLNSVMGSLFVQYNSLPMLGIKKCDTPLCKSASKSSLHLQWCFPRWLIARALVASLSWSSINDDGAALFLKVPRSMDGISWLVRANQDPRAFIERFEAGKIRPTDILAQWGQNLLTFCIAQWNWQLLPILLASGFDPMMKDLTGRCAVHWARQRELQGATYYMSEDTRAMLRQIAVMELEDAAPLTMIHQAMRGETTLSLDECIQMEPHHINTPDDVGFAPLHWAVWKEDIAAFQTLITASANVNQQTSHKRETPLHFACANHNVDMVRTLLDSGASASSLDSDKWTPLHYVASNIQGRQKEMDMVQMLLDAHADPHCGDGNGTMPLHLLFGQKNVDSDHVTALARALIDAGADLEAKDREGRTVLLYACMFSCQNVPSLIDLRTNVKAVDDNGENMLTKLINNETDLEPSLFRPELLVGVNPDHRTTYDSTSLDFLDERVRDSIMWRPLTIRVVVDMVDLILGTRDANWEAGLFLDKKQELEADGSHARMRRWVMHQRRLMQRDTLWGDYGCEEDDLQGWYEDEYNESSPSEIDDDDYLLSDDSGSEDLETMSEDEEDNEDDGNNGNDERDWSDDEDVITFHDAHETLE